MGVGDGETHFGGEVRAGSVEALDGVFHLFSHVGRGGWANTSYTSSWLWRLRGSDAFVGAESIYIAVNTGVAVVTEKWPGLVPPQTTRRIAAGASSHSL